MKLQYLGTAAAEGWPAVFCSCEACKNAKKMGGKNIRTRSQALIDDKILIDLPPDTYHHYLIHNIDMANIENLLVTHSHGDHFYADELEMRCPPFCDNNVKKMNIYGNNAVMNRFNEVCNREPRVLEHNYFNEIDPFVEFNVGGYKVMALEANHAKTEQCLIYLISDGDKTLLYAHDTGFLSEKTWGYLRGKKLDLVSMDCTTIYEPEGTNHMGFADNVEFKKQLIEEGCADKNTKFVSSHFSHNGLWTHEKLESEGLPHNILIAYDGFVVTV